MYFEKAILKMYFSKSNFENVIFEGVILKISFRKSIFFEEAILKINVLKKQF